MILFAFFIILVGLICDFKKTILIFAPFKFLFINSVLLFGNVSFENAISLIIFIVFFFKYKQCCKLSRYPLKYSLILLVLSESLAAIIGEPNYISIPLKFCRLYGFCLVFFYLLETKEDIKIVLESLSIFVIILVGNGLVELILDMNPIGDILASELRDDAFFIDRTDYGSRGMRVHSFLPHSICFGNVCAIFLFLYCFIKTHEMENSDKLYFIILLLILGIIMANSRTPLLALMLYAIPFLFNKKMLKYRLLLIMVVIIAGPFIIDKMYNMLDSMFNPDTRQDVGGSSMEMRLEQLEMSFFLIKDKLLLGNGFSFDFTIFSEMRGAESIWFNLLMYQGIFGCVAYIFMFIESIKRALKTEVAKFLIFLCLGYLLQQSATYNAGLDDFLYYFVYLLIFRYSTITNIYKPNRL